jgi:2-dehydropantoate 2-reductase
MELTMRMLVVGAGSTGGYFGGRLAQAGRDVSFLVRSARAAQLQAEGLQILSSHGDFRLQPQILTAASLTGTFDIVLLAVKAYSLAAALEDLAPAVGPSSLLLPLLNGLRHVDVLRERFGTQPLVGGVCKVSTAIDPQGRIVHLSPVQEIIYGEFDGSASPRIQALDAFMRGAGFSATLTRTVARDMWEKWIFLATLASVTCLLRGNVGEIQAAAGGADVMLRVFEEVVSIAKSAGITPEDKFLVATKAMLSAPGSAMSSSMHRDLQRGARIEADQIVGDLLLRGARAGLATPLLATAYAHLAVYQDRLCA